jgi:hypothetical protein
MPLDLLPLPPAGDGPMLLLDPASRARIADLLYTRRDVRWRPIGIEASFWRAFVAGRRRTVPVATWRLLCSWVPGLSRTIGAPL